MDSRCKSRSDKKQTRSSGVMDVNAMKLSPVPTSEISEKFLLAVFNSDIFFILSEKFLAHTWMAQISDVRMMRW